MWETDRQVLVLNNDYEPLNVCNVRRALVLVLLGKAEVLHVDGVRLRTVDRVIQVPSVVKLRYHVKRPLPELKLTRRTIFARDDYTCQYCGYRGKDLTVDHVLPKRLGGSDDWENLVTCCRKCNLKKGDKPLHQTHDAVAPATSSTLRALHQPQQVHRGRKERGMAQLSAVLQ